MSFEPLFLLDIEWCLRADKDAHLALSFKAYPSFEKYFIDGGLASNRQLLAVAAQPLEPLYRSLIRQDGLDLDAVLRGTYEAVAQGSLGHWLFAGEYYSKALAEYSSELDRRPLEAAKSRNLAHTSTS